MNPTDIVLSSTGVRLFARWAPAAGWPGALVLLPGLGFHSGEYEPLQALLATGGVSSLALDYRGHGRSAGARGAWTLDLLVADARAAVAWVVGARAGPTVMVGNSLGAMVAIATGNVEPRVAAVIASNCPARVADFLMTPARRALLTVARAVAHLVPLRVSVDHFYGYDRLVDDPALARRLASDAAIRSARRLSVAAYRALLDGWDGVREVARLPRPLLLVQGARDRLQPAEQTERLLAAAAPGTRRLVLDTGHLPTLERPGLMADAIRTWLPTLGEAT